MNFNIKWIKSNKDVDPHKTIDAYDDYRLETIEEIYIFNENKMLTMILTGKEYRHIKYGIYTNIITIDNKKSSINGGIPIVHYDEVFKVFADKNAICVYDIPPDTKCYKINDSYRIETINRTHICKMVQNYFMW